MIISAGAFIAWLRIGFFFIMVYGLWRAKRKALALNAQNRFLDDLFLLIGGLVWLSTMFGIAAFVIYLKLDPVVSVIIGTLTMVVITWIVVVLSNRWVRSRISDNKQHR